MKKSAKIIIICLFIYLGWLVFNNSLLVKESVVYAFDLWLRHVFPILFIMFIISDVLINYGFAQVLGRIFAKVSQSIFKVNGLSSYVLIASLISGSPSNAVFVKDLYENNYLTLGEANKILSFTFFLNPLFVYSFLALIFQSNTIILKIMLTVYLSNILVGYLIRNTSNKQTTNIIYKKENNLGFANIFTIALKKAMNNMLLVLGSITFFVVLSALCNRILNLNSINISVIRGVLEITSGLNELSKITASVKLKALLSGIFLSFGSFSIHMQIKSIIADTPVSYKFFFIIRILHSAITTLVLSIII